MAIFLQTGLFLNKQMGVKTKYGYEINEEVLTKNINRLTNQLWKLIPMRENNENWVVHLQGVLIELSGLGAIFIDSVSFLSLLSKLEGLIQKDTEFMLYRKTVFESISLLREIVK